MGVKIRIFIIAAALLSPVTAPARFGADLADSAWSSVPDNGACHLIHEVPHFGTLVITQHADLSFSSVIATRRPPPGPRAGRMVVETPEWKGRGQRELQSVEASPGIDSVHFDGRSSRALVHGLEGGDYLVLRFPNWAGSALEVALSPVGFRPALRRHLRCMNSDEDRGYDGSASADTHAEGDVRVHAAETNGGALREVGFASDPARAFAGAASDSARTAVSTSDPARTVAGAAGDLPRGVDSAPDPERALAGGPAPVSVHFAHDNARLDRVDLDVIAGIAERLEDGTGRERITIAGHTDATGRQPYNEALGLARALEVRNRLVQLGVDEDRMAVTTYAAERPLNSNDTRYGRASNRRVEVRGEP